MILSMLICDIICMRASALKSLGVQSSMMSMPGSDIIDKLTYDHYQILFQVGP